MKTVYWLIDYFPISLNILCLPPKFCTGIVFKCFWENAVLQGAFENSGSCKFFFLAGRGGWGGGGGATECISGDSQIENFYYIHKCI